MKRYESKLVKLKYIGSTVYEINIINRGLRTLDSIVAERNLREYIHHNQFW